MFSTYLRGDRIFGNKDAGIEETIARGVKEKPGLSAGVGRSVATDQSLKKIA